MSTLMNRAGWVAAGALALFVVAAIPGIVRSGPLDPPGPVASTGKGQISALPAVIDQPGSYLVMANLAGGGTGITINASDVTIDFQGFTLTGPGAASPGTGVSIPAAQSNITLKDGALRGWRSGVSAASTIYARIEGLTLIGTETGVGTGLTLGAHSVVERCNVSAFTGAAIVASYVTIRGCIIADNGQAGISSAEGSYIHDNLIRNNAKGVLISGTGIKPGAAFNYLRDNHICYNTLDIDTVQSEGKNVWVGNTFATFDLSIASGGGDLFNFVALDTQSAGYRPDLNNIRAIGDVRFGDCAR